MALIIRYTVEEEHETEAAEPNGAAAAVGDGSALPGVPSRQFWDDLLKEEHMQAEALKLAAMGKVSLWHLSDSVTPCTQLPYDYAA